MVTTRTKFTTNSVLIDNEVTLYQDKNQTPPLARVSHCTIWTIKKTDTKDSHLKRGATAIFRKCHGQTEEQTSPYLPGFWKRSRGRPKATWLDNIQDWTLDRNNMEAAQTEAELLKTSRNIKGAKYLVTGDVTEFGRKVQGDKQLFGLLGSGKQQVAYSKVILNVVNVKTSEVVVSVQGAGEYKLSTREVLGFGGAAWCAAGFCGC